MDYANEGHSKKAAQEAAAKAMALSGHCVSVPSRIPCDVH